MKKTFKNVSEIKAFATANGSLFFSKGATQAFKSKTHTGVYGGEYFVTSEDYGNGEVFKVRRVNQNGRISTVIREFDTLADARAHAKALVKEFAAAA